MIKSFVSFCPGFFKSRTQLQLEIVYLRKQLDIVTRTSAGPRPSSSDRFFFYNTQRAQLGLKKESPEPERVEAVGEIERVVVANGLHHFYFRKAA